MDSSGPRELIRVAWFLNPARRSVARLSVDPDGFLYGRVHRRHPIDPVDGVGEVLGLPLLSVVHYHQLELRPHLPDEPDNLVVVAVAAEPFDLLHGCPHID